MTTTVQELLAQHPVNPVHDTKYYTSSNKAWTKAYPPITNMRVHTQVLREWTDERGDECWTVKADFDGPFLPEYDDDHMRFGERVYPPSYRKWRLSSEKDGHLWFHTEVSNIVLAAWANYPNIFDAAEEKPHSDENSKETVDTGYSIKHQRHSLHLAVGEFKRGLLDFQQWQTGRLKGSNLAFSQELRA